MEVVCKSRSIIGEGPIWNEKEKKLYFTNGLAHEIIILDIYTGEETVRRIKGGAAALAFDKNNRLIVSESKGIFYLNEDNVKEPLFDNDNFPILFANDMKVGPDGRIYVGTISGKRYGVSDQIDGKLYSIDSAGNVRVLLDGLILSNGMDWSMDEKRFYHTDSDTHVIKEYSFDKETGDIQFTGRQVKVDGVDGLTIDSEDRLYAASWGNWQIVVVDTNTMKITEYIHVPTKIPASCGFAGNNLEYLTVVTASSGRDISSDTNAGLTFLHNTRTRGRKPFLFG